MRRNPCVWRGIVAGAVAGTLGSLVMAVFQRAVAESEPVMDRRSRLAAGESSWSIEQNQAGSTGGENTTEKFARELSERAARPLSDEEKRVAGRVVHYLFGAAVGAVYGASAEYLPIATMGAGTAFGTVLFAAADEWSLPKLDLAQRPGEMRAKDHLLHWASHAVFGAATEGVRSVLRARM